MPLNRSFLFSVIFLMTPILGWSQVNSFPVFVLAGQSNMQGQGVVDLDHPKYYNGGRGNLSTIMKQSPRRFGHLVDEDGKWVVRNDVFVRYQTDQGLKQGGLTIGFTGYGGKHHIGPELQFGHRVGDALNSPVLLIKTAWGGKSLFKDFRPPSAGGMSGEYYRRMIRQVRQGMDKACVEIEAFRGLTPQLAGLVWQQGWNDMVSDSAVQEYEQNLVHLINDFRTEFATPALPIVIGELGNDGPDAGSGIIRFRKVQAAAADRREFRGTVAFVSTSSFARPSEQSPNTTHGHHWYGNAESYFLIGDALGKQMLKMLPDDSVWFENSQR